MSKVANSLYDKAISPIIEAGLAQKDPEEVKRLAINVGKTLTEREVGYLLIEATRHIFSHKSQEAPNG